jgi:hypothetical protein
MKGKSENIRPRAEEETNIETDFLFVRAENWTMFFERCYTMRMKLLCKKKKKNNLNQKFVKAPFESRIMPMFHNVYYLLDSAISLYSFRTNRITGRGREQMSWPRKPQ